MLSCLKLFNLFLFLFFLIFFLSHYWSLLTSSSHTQYSSSAEFAIKRRRCRWLGCIVHLVNISSSCYIVIFILSLFLINSIRYLVCAWCIKILIMSHWLMLCIMVNYIVTTIKSDRGSCGLVKPINIIKNSCFIFFIFSNAAQFTWCSARYAIHHSTPALVLRQRCLDCRLWLSSIFLFSPPR